MYVLRQVDRAGNDFEIHRRESFARITEKMTWAKSARPDCVFYIVNEETMDVDDDGLTDEERELL